MGCFSGKAAAGKPLGVPVLRRGLTMSEPGPDDEAANDVSEEDRSTLMMLTQAQVMDMVQREKHRKYSIGSETDRQGHLVRSFSSKSIKLQGEVFEASSEGIGFACKKGLKPEAPNQDSFFIMKVEDEYSLYGVFDGHGRKGHDISNFVKDNLPKLLFQQDNLLEDPQASLTKAFEKTQYLIEKATSMKTIDATRSGTTCSVVLHAHKQSMLHIAHVGDSRVVLGKGESMPDGQQTWRSVDLTIDHRPDLPEERERIERAGGVVVFDGGWNYRVYAKGKTDARGKRYPGLNMSRAMGDLSGFNDAGISAMPDINSRPLATEPPPEMGLRQYSMRSDGSKPTVSSREYDPATDKFILLCSDGVWEFVSSDQAVLTVAQYSRSEALAAAEHLAATAWDRWMTEMDGQVVDDITAVLVHLGPNDELPATERPIEPPAPSVPSPPSTPLVARPAFNPPRVGEASV